MANSEPVGGYCNCLTGWHFHCGHNISNEPKILMVIKAMKRVSIDELSETEKEIAAKVFECDYLRKTGNLLEPQIIVIDRKNEMDFYNLSFHFNNNMGIIIDQSIAEPSEFMKKHIPEQLMNEYQIYTQLSTGIRILPKAIEKCIK